MKNADVVTCSKCEGTGKYYFNNGMVGVCYGCDGRGIIRRIAHKNYLVTVFDGEKRIKWIHVWADGPKSAMTKAKKTAVKGCFKGYVDTIEVTEDGTAYTYSKLK